MKRLTILLLLAGCTDYDLSVNSEFIPGQGGFDYDVIADIIYPLNSSKAEGHRMDRLNKYIDENGVCPNGYTLTSRVPIHVSKKNFRIYYTGTCHN